MTLLVGYLTHNIVPKVTDNVLSGTLNPTILYSLSMKNLAKASKFSDAKKTCSGFWIEYQSQLSCSWNCLICDSLLYAFTNKELNFCFHHHTVVCFSMISFFGKVFLQSKFPTFITIQTCYQFLILLAWILDKSVYEIWIEKTASSLCIF